MLNYPVLFIVGPTAVGKTEIAIQVAEEMNAEIISADSRQVYKLMTIGTAKPDQNQLKRVKHHFINELYPDESFSAGTFQTDGRIRLLRIAENDKPVIVVGGSGLYIKALLDGVANIPTCHSARRMIEENLKMKGAVALYEKLKSIDPDSARKMDPTKTQRLIRALEVYFSTGKTLSWWQKNRVPEPFPFSFLQIGLDIERSVLYDRINLRVDHMMKNGLLDEVSQLKKMGYSENLNSLKTVGYQEIFDFFNGYLSLPEAVEMIKQHSRNYAKRQWTWFRKDLRITWLNPENTDIVSQITNLWQSEKIQKTLPDHSVFMRDNKK